MDPKTGIIFNDEQGKCRMRRGGVWGIKMLIKSIRS